VDVRRPRAHGLVEQALQQLDDRGVLGAGLQAQGLEVDRGAFGAAQLVAELLGQALDVLVVAVDAVDQACRPTQG
jgi:hypothetical protein